MPNLVDLIPRVFVYNIDPLGAASDTFVIGHATRGRLGASAGNKLATTAQSDSVVDITEYCETVDIQIGKRRSLDSYDASNCTLTLDAADRRFDQFTRDDLEPEGNDGAYQFLAVSGRRKNLFGRGRRVRVVLVQPGAPTVVDFYLWSGFLDTVETEYAPNPNSKLIRSQVRCVDGFDVLGRFDGLEVSSRGALETCGPRVRRVLEMANWTDPIAQGMPVPNPFTIGDTLLGRLGAAFDNRLGTAAVAPVSTTISTGAMRGYGYTGAEGAVSLLATTLQGNALSLIKAAVASEGGQCWIDRAGRVRWSTRADLPVATAASRTFIFSDEGVPITVTATGAANTYTGVDSSLEFTAPTFSADTDELVTVCTMPRIDGSEIRVEDADARAEYGAVSYSRSDLICADDNDALWACQRIIAGHKAITSRVTGVRIMPQFSTGAMYVAAVPELNATGQFHDTGHDIDRYVYLIGMHHTIRPNALDGWVLDLTLTEAS